MFTGLVEATAEVISRTKSAAGERLVLRLPQGLRSDVGQGDSVAVNGLCLSAVEIGDGRLGFDVIHESLRRSNLGSLKPGDRVNVETALRIGDPLGGHMVAGHIDCTGEVLTFSADGTERVLRMKIDSTWRPFLFEKGSVAINGVSLTLASVEENALSVCLIPVTLETTNLGQTSPGDRLNLEFDQTARYIVETTQQLWKAQQTATNDKTNNL